MAESTILNFTNEEALDMMDALSRIPGERRIKPLDQFDYIQYDHRYAYDTYNLLIGDSYFMIPPEFIKITSESRAQSITTLRQESTLKAKNGYHNRTIYIDMVFNGFDEINGFKVKGPLHDDGNGILTDECYVDGLRQLLAQFKYTPFLPITNEFINNTYGIFTVALQSITIQTMDGFPDTMKAQIILQEAELFPYIEQPDIVFQYMIDWDLYRYHIQSFLTENHEYRKLQSLPSKGNDHRAFKLSILNEEYLKDENWMYKDKNIISVLTNEDSYIESLDSTKEDIYITEFHAGYQNILTNVQLQGMPSPTIQFIGGMDTIYTIMFETTSQSAVQLLEMCQVQNDLLIRNNPHYRGACGFVKFQCDLVQFTGSLFVMVEKVESNTVPGLPGLYSVQMNCVAYDIANTKRESLHGFMPFDGSATMSVHDARTIGAAIGARAGLGTNSGVYDGYENDTSNSYNIDPTLDEYFNEASKKYNIDKQLLLAVAKTESDFDPNAVSSAGAVGIMQLMPATASDLGVTNSYDPHDNIFGGAKLLRNLINKYNGNLDKALAAYNTGSGNVDKYGIKPSVQEYVDKVKNNYKGKAQLPTNAQTSTVNSALSQSLSNGGNAVGYTSQAGYQCIEQNISGWKIKTNQDNYAECKIKNSMEVYPDLRLPTYTEIALEIEFIKQFRNENNLTPLPYDAYPIQPVCMIHGVDPNNPPDVMTQSYAAKSCIDWKDIIAAVGAGAAGGAAIGLVAGTVVPGIGNALGSIGGLVVGGGAAAIAAGGAIIGAAVGGVATGGAGVVGDLVTGDSGTIVAYIEGTTVNSAVYAGYVDPDFYIFYPVSYSEYSNDSNDFIEPKKNGARSYNWKTETFPDYTGSGQIIKDKAEAFVTLAKTFVGCSYVWGAEGEISDSHGLCFDCSGFVTYLLKKMGIMPNNMNRLTVSTIPGSDIFQEIPWNQRKRGDVLVNNTLNHVVIYEGHDKIGEDAIVHAANVRDGVKEGKLYFIGRAFRVKAFIDNTIQGTQSSDPYSDNEAQYPSLNEAQDDTSNRYSLEESEINTESNQGAWDNIKKQDSLNDYAIAGIMGYAKSVGLDSNAVWNELRNDETVVNSLKHATTAEQAASIVARKAANATDESIMSGASTSITKATASATSFYNVFSVEAQQADISGLTAPSTIGRTDNTNEELLSVNVERDDNGNGIIITNDEFDSICRVVATECQGEPLSSKQAMAQLIYDRFTCEGKRFGGITNILGDRKQFKQPLNDIDEIEMNDAQSAVRGVFCSGVRWRPSQTLLYFSTDDVLNASFIHEADKWSPLGSNGSHYYWGRLYPSNVKRYVIAGNGVGAASNNTYEQEHSSNTFVENVNQKRFGKPVLFKAEMNSRNSTYGNAYENTVNSPSNQFNTSFVDECQYSAKGRLVKAFPAFLFCILDEGGGWYDGRKLWTNYYIYKSVVSIVCHSANDMPTSTCNIVVTNTYHNLDQTQRGLQSYSILGDNSGYAGPLKFIYKHTGCLLGGIKITDKLIELHQIIYDHAKLREDARVHVRMGYGSDPFSLAPIINGTCSSIMIGDQISIEVTSDGHELIQGILSSKEKDTNNGAFGLFGLLETQEASDLIAQMLIKRSSFINMLDIKFFGLDTANYFENSKYHIEHYGLYMRNLNESGVSGTSAFMTGAFIGNIMAPGIGATIGGIAAAYDAEHGSANGFMANAWKDFPIHLGINIDMGIKNQYDILKNIYRSNYKHTSYMYPLQNGLKALLRWDDEKNLVFSKYNMTPWDLIQMCAQTMPEFIGGSIFHQFEHRVYYGMPHWMMKYRYSITAQGIYEECKAHSQVHFIDSISNIIDNNTRVTSQFRHTNVKVMYVRGKTPTTTGVLHSDVYIDSSKQRTVILDTPIVQDELGPDCLYEIVGDKKGRTMAKAIGVSDLLMSWEKEYQGELLILGNPGIKPDDYVMINDTFANMFGIAKVREVVHRFDANSGFTTGIVLGVLAFTRQDDTGQIQHVQNLLKLLSTWAQFSCTKKQGLDNWEKYKGIISQYDSTLKAIRFGQSNKDYFGLITGGAKLVTTGISTFVIIKKIHDISDTFKSLETGFNYFKGFAALGKHYWRAMKAVKDVKNVKTGINFLKSIENLKKAEGIAQAATAFFGGGGAAAESATLGAGVASSIATAGLAIVVMLAVDIALDWVFEFFEQRQMVTLLPLWYENQPYIAGIKNGTGILLCGEESNAAEETDHLTSNETEEDNDVVNDNPAEEE